MAKQIFRKKLTDNISSMDDLNKYISVVRPSSWMFAIGVSAIIIGFVVWAFVGSMTDTVNVPGIIFPTAGMHYVYAENDCVVKNTRVGIGDSVWMNTIIATVSNDELYNKLKSMKNNSNVSKDEYEVALKEYNYKTKIYSGADGNITNILKNGDAVKKGDKIADVMVYDFTGNDKEVRAFVSSAYGKKIKVGMEAQVSMEFAPREVYGYMIGYVSHIDKFMLSKENIQKELGDTFNVDKLPDENFYQVKITLSVGTGSSGIEWSNEKGNSLDVKPGIQCNVHIVTDRYKPIELIF